MADDHNDQRDGALPALPEYPTGVLVRLVFNGVGGTGIFGVIRHVLPEGIVLFQPEPSAPQFILHESIALVEIVEETAQ